MPDAAPVTIARLPERAIPSTTSAAVECRPNGVTIGAIMRSFTNLECSTEVIAEFDTLTPLA
jgi:hypothetical protein